MDGREMGLALVRHDPYRQKNAGQGCWPVSRSRRW